MQNVKDMALEIVSIEGGYVNDPDDPGGGDELWRHSANTQRDRSSGTVWRGYWSA